MKKIYLHLGLHKTGSTSFQHTCKKNVEALLEQGFVYPLFNSAQISYKDIDNHSYIFNSMFNKKPETFYGNIHYNVKDCDSLHNEYKETFLNYINLKKDIILSCETITNLKVDELIQFKKYLESFDYEIIPIAVVRSPYSFTCSYYQQITKMGFTKEIGIIKQKEKIEKIQEFFPNTLFIPFKPALNYEHGIIGTLFSKMGIDYKNFEIIKSNESVGNILTRLQAEINRHKPRFIAGKININNLKLDKIMADIDLNSAPFKEKFYFTKEEYSAIKEDFDKENAFLKEHLGEEFCDTDINFSEENNDIVKFCTALIQAYEAKPEKDIIIKYYKFRYITALFLSKITFGKARQKYMKKVNFYNKLLIITQGKEV